ncbi:hypothetical protein JCM3766R1_005258 [Sporobolomyces carnicolor]
MSESTRFALDGNSAPQPPANSGALSNASPRVAYDAAPYASPHAHPRFLPPGAAYAAAPSPAPTREPAHLHRPLAPPHHHRHEQPPTLTLSIGQRDASGTPSPLVASSEWPATTPSPSPSTSSRNLVPPAAVGSSSSSSLSSSPLFVGVPSGRLHLQQQQQREPSPTRQTQSAHFPAQAAPLLSPHDAVLNHRDRGPYPPHVRSQSAGNLLASASTSSNPRQYARRQEQEEEPAELLVERGETNVHERSREGDGASRKPTTTLSPPNMANAPRPLSIADQIVGTPPPLIESPPSNFADVVGRRSYYLDDNTTPVTSSDMAGVGRNSIIRSVGATSPVLNFRTSLGNDPAAAAANNNLSSQQATRSSMLVQIAPSGGGGPVPAAVVVAPNGAKGGTAAATSALASLPPHLVPQPEICVECMMRDRDMADVDVTTRGIWDRESDRDWHEQLEWERAQERDRQRDDRVDLDDAEQRVRHELAGALSTHGTASQESAGAGGGDKQREDSATNPPSHPSSCRGEARTQVGKRKKLGTGQALTSGNLKQWTTMNPPAAAHRWRTLQTFLATQIHLLELERQAHVARESALLSSSRDSHHHHHQPQNRSSRSSTYHLPISTTPDPYDYDEGGNGGGGGRARAKSGGAGSSSARGYLVDETNRKSTGSTSLFPPPGATTTAYHQPQPQGPSQRHSHSYPQPSPSPSTSMSNNPYPTHPQYMHPSLASSGASIQSYSYGDQPWLASQSSRRYSYSKGAESPLTPQSKSPAPSMKFSLPRFGARSTTDLRSISSPRSLSPARNSLNVFDDRDRDRDRDGRRSSTSIWSKFRNSTTSNQSVMSFNPSASMMDMHLGLSQDKHGLDMYRGGHHGGGGGALGGGRDNSSAYASSTIGIGPRGYSYHQPQSTSGGLPYGTFPGGGGRGLNLSDPAVARHAELRERDRAIAAAQQQQQQQRARGGLNDSASSAKDRKQKKKGIKGFLSKLVGGGGGDKQGARDEPSYGSIDQVNYERAGGGGGGGGGDRSLRRDQGPSARGNPNAPLHPDDDELAPPPPLSALANEPRYHQRSSSTSSVDSFTGPYTPPLHASNFRSSYSTMPLPSSSTGGSNNGGGGGGGGRSSHPSRDSVNRPSFDSLNDPALANAPPPRLSYSPETQYARYSRDGGGPAEVLTEGGGDLDAVPSPSSSAYPTYSSTHAPPSRLHKSLPLLPDDSATGPVSSSSDRDRRQHTPPSPRSSRPQRAAGQFYPHYDAAGPSSSSSVQQQQQGPAASRSAYSLVQFPSRPLSPPDSTDERERYYSSVASRGATTTKGTTTGGRVKARSTVFSFFGGGGGGGGGGKKKSCSPDVDVAAEDGMNGIDGNSLGGLQRARSFDLVSRY